MIVDSLHEVGAARSIVIDEAGRILAGNGTVEAAAEAGIERVQVVDADGETLIAVRRRGLTEAQKKRLALLDNRTGELAEWDAGVLAELAANGLEMADLWSENELNILLGKIEPPDDPRAHWTGMDDLENDARACRSLLIRFEKPEHVEAFAALLDQVITDKTASLWYPAKE